MVLLLVILTSSAHAVDPITVTDNHLKLDLYVIVPEDVVQIGVAVQCEHLYKTSSRDVRFRQEHFLFRDLHDDAYDIDVVFVHRDGHHSFLASHAYVSR